MLPPYTMRTSVGEILVPAMGQLLADESMNFLRLGVGGIVARADGPDRFIGDDQPRRILMSSGNSSSCRRTTVRVWPPWRWSSVSPTQ
jgi:hypothetical protein